VGYRVLNRAIARLALFEEPKPKKSCVPFSPPKGTIEMLAETSIKGKTLHLKDVAIYPKGVQKLQIGHREVAALRDQLANEAKKLGFKKLRITGHRYTGANKGKDVDLIIDLTK
jgi:hypothetical protein